MIEGKQSQRILLKTTGLATAIGLAGHTAFAKSKTRVKISQWSGFNLLDFFSSDPTNPRPSPRVKYF